MPDAPSDAVSLAAVDVAAHPVAGFVYTYASPFPTSSAPTTTVPPSPLTDTASPKSSVPAGLGLVSFTPAAVDAHPVAGLVNTYAPSAPEVIVPTTIVSPFALTDTRHPNRSFAVLVGGVSMTPELESAHPVDGLVYTYTAPALEAPVVSTPSAPATIVFPSALIAADIPSESLADGLA